MSMRIISLFVLVQLVAPAGNGLDFFGIDQFVGALGIQGGANKFLQCQRSGVGEACAKKMLKEGALGQALGPLSAFIDVDAITKNVQLCKDKNSEKAETIKDWLTLLSKGGFAAAATQACKQQICDELRKCEETVKNMCNIMEMLTSRGGFDMFNVLGMLGESIKKNSATEAAQSACEKLAALADAQNTNTGDFFTDFFNIGKKAVAGQAAGSVISNPGAAANMFTGGGGNPLAGLGNLGSAASLIPAAGGGGGLGNLGSAAGLLSGGGGSPFANLGPLANLFGRKK